jgi:hypothetical protein
MSAHADVVIVGRSWTCAGSNRPPTQDGLDVSYETVRRWVLKFGPPIARRLFVQLSSTSLASGTEGSNSARSSGES